MARVAAEFDGWAPELTALITDGETDPVARTIHALPTGHRWERVPGVTLLGDAAHLMSPAGEGANLAMYDGAELGKAIAAHRDDLEAALAEYEESMFARSAIAAAESARTLALLFDDNAPQGLIDFFTGSSAPTSPAPSPAEHVTATEIDTTAVSTSPRDPCPSCVVHGQCATPG